LTEPSGLETGERELQEEFVPPVGVVFGDESPETPIVRGVELVDPETTAVVAERIADAVVDRGGCGTRRERDEGAPHQEGAPQTQEAAPGLSHSKSSAILSLRSFRVHE
jgi:hypothetical protein